MAAKVYYDDDADLSLLKNKTIAIIGYGSQGHAQAQNLRDSGCNVIIGQRPGGPNYDLAISHGFQPMSAADAAEKGDLINILLPDELQGDVYRNDIKPRLKPGNLLMCSHGFNIHFGQVQPPQGVDAALVAPKGPGHLVRSEYEKGGGVPSLIALSDGTQRLLETLHWLMPRASAGLVAASLKPRSLKKQKPTCLANRLFCVAVSVHW